MPPSKVSSAPMPEQCPGKVSDDHDARADGSVDAADDVADAPRFKDAATTTGAAAAAVADETIDVGTIKVDACDEAATTQHHNDASPAAAEARHRIRRHADHAWTQNITHRLYGREEQVSLLNQIATSMTLHARPSKTDTTTTADSPSLSSPFVLITGPAGVGKKHLVEMTLKEPCLQLGGFFLSCQFDDRLMVPYAPYVSMIAQFTKQVFEQGEDVLHETKQRIRDSVRRELHTILQYTAAHGEELDLEDFSSDPLHDFAPDMNQLLRVLDDNGDAMGGVESISIARFQFMFRLLLMSICGQGRPPVVLLLHDLGLADKCSVDLLTYLLGESIEGLVVVATSEGDAATCPETNAYLSSKIAEIERKVDVVRCQLTSLDVDSVNQMIADAFRLPPQESRILADPIWQRTEGGPYHVIKYLEWLVERGVVYHDDDAAVWTWENEELQTAMTAEYSLHELLALQLENLPLESREGLQLVSCLGPTVDEALLEYALGEQGLRGLQDPLVQEVLIYQDNRKTYAFTHSCFREGAYRLVPESEREAFHHKLGKRLWLGMGNEELEKYIFVVLSQMSLGRRYIASKNERMAVATWCLHAGQVAAKAAAFPIASSYLEFARGLLREIGWQENYYLTLAVHNSAAEMELCETNFERMDEIVDTIICHVRNWEDEIQASATRIYSLGAKGMRREAITLSVKVLKDLGETFPSRVTPARLYVEFNKVRNMLRSKSDQQLLRLPDMDNANFKMLKLSHILHLMLFSAGVVQPALGGLICLKLVKIALLHGMTPFAVGAFAGYGVLCAVARGDFDEAERYGALSLKFLRRFKSFEFVPRVFGLYYGLIYGLKRRSEGAIDPLRRAHLIGLQSGDYEFACVCAKMYCIHGLAGGLPLPVVHENVSRLRQIITATKQKTFAVMIFPTIHAIHQLMGLSEQPFGNAAVFDSNAPMETNVAVVAGRATLRVMVAYIFNDHELASQKAASMKALSILPPVPEILLAILFTGLSALAMARQGVARWKNIRKARQLIRRYRHIAAASPHNGDKSFLLQAELASVQGKHARAFEHYTYAIAVSSDSGSLLVLALAAENCARHLYGIGETVEARRYFAKALSSYEEWGAKGKVVRLSAEIESTFGLSK